MRVFVLVALVLGAAPVRGLANPSTEPAPAAADRSEAIELTFAGDVMFGRFVPGGFRPIRAERQDPFKRVAPLMKSDLAMVNLETPVMRKPPKESKYGTRMRFVAPPKRVKTLPKNGITAVTLANNHYWDMHKAGVLETPTILAELGITAVGATRHEDPLFRVETVTVRGWKIGFVAAAAVCNTEWATKHPKLPYAEPPDFARQVEPVIRAARKDHDLVIATFHWGEEYEDAPAGWQVRAARRMIDAGADAVIGHHPHVLQGIERYKHGVIAYSLGNFLFDNTYTTRRWSGVLRLRFERPKAGGGAACLEKPVFHPVVVTRDPFLHPSPARGKNFKAVAARIAKLSKLRKLGGGTRWTVEGDRLVTQGACPH